MKKGTLRTQEQGLTITEMLIVLAVAGLILLIVLMALPALTRNSRNGQRNQDAQIILQAVSHYELNHSGTIPNTAQLISYLNNYEKGNLTLFDPTPSNITVHTPPATNVLQTYPATPATISTLQVYNHSKCSTGGQATNRGAGYSDIVALYVIETANGFAPRCQQL